MASGSVWRLSVPVVLALFGAVLAGPSFAQETTKEKQEATEKEKQKTEEEILKGYVETVEVTAQKRTEDVQTVPESVWTLGGSDILAITAGGQDIMNLSGRVPSLTLESSFGRAFPRFYIRGLGNTDFDLNASQPVSMLVDEVVLENPVVKGMPLFDLDRVEVLRGPQGTLFGRNTPAGVVKFDTKRPTKDFDASFRLSYGTFNTVDFSGGVGGALSDTVSARFSALVQHRDDWVDNKFRHKKNLGGYDTKAYRLQFLWEPNDRFKGLLNVHGWQLDGTARIFRANIIKKGTNDFVPGFEQDVVYHDGLNEQKIRALGASFRIDYELGDATLTSITAYEGLDNMYSRGDIDGGYGAVYAPPYGPGFIPFASESADGIPTLTQFTEEVRLASNSKGPFNWLVGGFFFDEKLMVQTFGYDSLAPGNPQNGYAIQQQQTDAYALFGSLDYVVSDKWSLKGGLRFSHDKKDFSAERPWPEFNNTVTVAPITRHTDSNNVSGDLSALYKVDTDLNLYGRIATGFRAPSIQGRILFCADPDGGANPATNCVSMANTEKIVSAEVGLKTILADHRLRLNLAAFVYQVDGQQITAVGGQYNTATLLNVDKTDGHGLEADVEYIPSGNWWMNLGMSWNSAKINDPNLTVAACAGGCTITNRIAPNGSVYVDGNQLPNAPEWIFNGIVNYQSSPLDKGYFGTLDWAYASEKSFFLYESKEFKSDSLEFGLRLGYGWDRSMYEVALFARNLFNKKILQGGIDFDNLTGMTNEPRTVGVEFVARF